LDKKVVHGERGDAHCKIPYLIYQIENIKTIGKYHGTTKI
jgi:hypothetical protein